MVIFFFFLNFYFGNFSVNLNLFYCISSGNNEQISQATEAIIDSFENPEYLIFLLHSLSSSDDLKIQYAICIVLTKFLAEKYKKKDFFNYDQISFANEFLFELLFKLHFELRTHIISDFKIMISQKKYDYNSFVSKCIHIIAENNNLADTTTAFLFLDVWYEREQGFGPVHSQMALFFQTIVPYVHTILKQVCESPIVDQSACFVISASHFLSNLVRSDQIILFHEFSEIISMLASFLRQQVSSLEISKAKIEIIKCFQKMLYLFAPVHAFAPLKRPYIQEFSQNVGPLIVHCILDSLINIISQKTNENSSLLLQLLEFFLALFKRKVYREIFLVDELMTQILIPASILTNEDAEIFSDIPEQFLEFCLVFDSSCLVSSVRKCISCIVKELPHEYINSIFSYLISPSSSPVEYEAKIFLISSIFQHHKISIDMFSSVVSSLNQNPPFFLMASLLILLANNIGFDHSSENVAIASYILTNVKNPVVQVAASNLLAHNIDEQIQGTNFPIEAIISSLLDLITVVQHKVIGELLEHLVYLFPDSFMSISMEFISTILSVWNTSQNNEEGDKNSSPLLLSIAQIISNLPKNCETLIQLSMQLLPFILNFIRNSSSDNGFDQFIDIVGCLIDKIDDLPSIFFSILILIHDKIDDDMILLYMPSFTTLICALIQKHNFVSESSQNNIHLICNICDSIFTSQDKEYALPSCFIIMTTLVQTYGSTVIPTLKTSIDYLSKFSNNVVDDAILDDTFIASVILLSSALIVDETNVIPIILQAIPNYIIYWINNYNKLFFIGSQKQYIHWSILGLLIISKYNITEAYISAVKQFLYIQTLDDDDELENSLDIKVDSFPFNNLTCDDQIFSIGFDDPRFIQLPDEQKRVLVKYFPH